MVSALWFTRHDGSDNFVKAVLLCAAYYRQRDSSFQFLRGIVTTSGVVYFLLRTKKRFCIGSMTSIFARQVDLPKSSRLDVSCSWFPLNLMVDWLSDSLEILVI
ncbi:hypothetical protein T01_12339 [Trichinella spiralis]|uniref:Uncharacterized protein n=1 Tax=Trichinella spiralis TaxID=6334 RepID=A0A0V1BVE8_TRISP|nr:hypothetical protein T01_12339 [Trichinella spiralis]